MRQIKFRAWDKVWKNMHYDKDWAVCFTGEMLCMDSDAFDTGKDAWLPLRARETREYELMQFTGLLDKNGKEIYEGDILKGRFNGVVEWTNECAKYNNGWSSFWDNSEIVGNIYENPELLKQ
jgi:uncharacterized phage protein (TIGR01671 family)